MAEKMQHRLAAVIAADVVGYTRLVEQDTDGTVAAWNAARSEVIRPTVESFSGRIVKLTGDGFLAEFASVQNATNCAISLQDGLASNALRFRVGVSLGDVVDDGDDIHGEGVNIAARIEAICEPGGICVSGTVFDAVRNRVDARFEDLGEHTVKHVTAPVRVYSITPSDGSPSSVSPAAKIDTPVVQLEIPDKPSIAILPFTNMSGDPEQEYFSDGITEDVITELSRFRQLFVIGRNSSFSYKNKPQDLRQIARELGVRYILEGSVRRSGNRVRVTAQLIDGPTGGHTWAERYDRNLDDIFAVQDEITIAVVGAVAPQIEIAERARIQNTRSGNLTAYDLALQAQAMFYEGAHWGNSELRERAIIVADEALALDPKCVNALWIKAYAHAMKYLYRWRSDPEQALEVAFAAANRLIEVDGSDASGYSARGLVNVLRRDYDASLADCARAYALNPNHAWNFFCWAWCESLAGKTEDAKEHAAMALRLSPRDTEGWLGDAYLALLQACFAEGDYEQAAKWGEISVQMTPKAPIRRSMMIVCCNELGRSDEAAKHAQALNAFAPDFIPSLLSGELSLYKLPEHNRLLTEGLRKAGLG